MTIAFLALIVVIVAVGVGALSLRSRQPTSIDSGIQSFRREMNALAPHQPIVRPGVPGVIVDEGGTAVATREPETDEPGRVDDQGSDEAGP